jgi:predicted RNase H-like HicB family nuclease
MKIYFYKAIIEPQEEGGFTAYIPGLPGCVSEGEVCREAIENIREALELYIDTLKERQQPIIMDNTHIAEICTV